MAYKFSPEWSRLPVVIVAGGPSFTAADARAIGMAKADGKVRVVAVNDAVYPCWFADVAYASDVQWWERHNYLPGYPGLRLGLRAPLDDRGQMQQPKGIDCLESSGREGFDPDPTLVRNGGNSGYAILHQMIHVMPPRVILTGFDMKGDHWFGKHDGGLENSSDKQKGFWIDRFRALAEAVRFRDIAIQNASNDTALFCFPRVSLKVALEST